MAAPEQTAPEVEGQHHTYVTNKMPWYVYLMWVLFLALFIFYVLNYFFPALQQEILAPP